MAVNPYSRPLLFVNNAQTTLAGSISNSDVTINLAPGGGAQFGTIPTGYGIPCTLTDRGTGLLREIVLMTARTGDTVTVIRAQEGTTGLSWSANDLFAQLVTAGDLATMVQLGDLQSQSTNYAVDTGAANSYLCALDPPITAPVVGMPIRVKITNSNTTASTLDPGSGSASIRRRDGTVLIGGELVAGDIVEFKWDGTYYRIEGIAPATAAAVTAGTDTQSGITPAQLAAAVALRSYLSGLTLSTAGSSATFGIAAGVATDSTNVFIMALASAYTKTTSAWAVGTGNGALDTGSIANSTWYHIFLIRRPDTGVVDVLISLSATSPTLPTNYTQFRRIGSMQTNGSAQWVKFKQVCDDFYRLQIQDYSLPGTTQPATLSTLSVPTGVVVEPFTNIVAQSINNNVAYVQYAPASDATLLETVMYHYEGNAGAASSSTNTVIGPPTNTSAQIYIGLPSSNGGETLYIYTYGWRDTRGRDF